MRALGEWFGWKVENLVEISVIVKENVKHLSVFELEREDIKGVVCRGKVLLVWEGEDQMKV